MNEIVPVSTARSRPRAQTNGQQCIHLPLRRSYPFPSDVGWVKVQGLIFDSVQLVGAATTVDKCEVGGANPM